MPLTTIPYHSGFGHTAALARCVAEGVERVDGALAVVVDVTTLPDPVGPDKEYGEAWAPLVEASALVFGSPTYMGGVSAAFRVFMEQTSALWGRQGWKDRIAAGFTVSAGLAGDKLQAMQDLVVFAAQHSMVWVPLGVMPTGDVQAAGDDSLNRVCGFLGAMATAGNDSPDVTPPEGDRETARLLGERVARLAARLDG